MLKTNRNPQVGDIRIKTRFLLFPKIATTYDGKHTCFGWLQKASWKEVYHKSFNFPGTWDFVDWVTDPELIAKKYIPAAPMKRPPPPPSPPKPRDQSLNNLVAILKKS